MACRKHPVLAPIFLSLFLTPSLAADVGEFQVAARYPAQKVPLNMRSGVLTSLQNVGDLKLAQGRLWVATEGGLLAMDLKTRRWGVVWDENRELFQAVRQLSYSAPYLWAACDNGLFRLDLASKKCVRFTTRDGLLSDAVRRVSSDKRGAWISYSWIQKGTAPSEVNNDPTGKAGPPKVQQLWNDPETATKTSFISQLDLTGKVLKHWDIPKGLIHKSADSLGIAFEWEDNRVFQLLLQGPVVWIGQNGCIRRLDASKGSWSAWSFEKITHLESLVRAGSIQMFKDKGRILVGVDRPYPALWMECDPVKNEWSVTQAKFQLPAAQGENLSWVGSSYDLTSASRFVLRHIQDHETDWKDEGLDPEGLWYPFFNCLLPIEDSTWLGAVRGLYRYENKTSSLVRLMVALDNTPAESKNVDSYPLRVWEKRIGKPTDATPTPRMIRKGNL